MQWRAYGAALALGIFALDQTSKLLARNYLAEPITLGPFLNLQLSFNTGVTFGLFAGGGDLGRWLLVAATAAMGLGVVVWMWREPRRRVTAPLALVAGGALGNVLDRLRAGAVTDFIDAHIGEAHWPTSNLADCAIVIGVAWLILSSFRHPSTATDEAERARP